VAGKAGEPLIVDWKPEQRGDLEVAMKQGVAVLAYDCKGIRLLPDCHLDGTYAFIATTRSEEVVQLANADEVRANLPLSGATLGAEVSGSAAIDIAMVMVGKKSTTVMGPAKSDLKGACDGATHYVRRATVGAFAMGTGTEGRAKAVVEIFGAGAGGASTSTKKVENKQGDLNDCTKASPDQPTPPPQCGAPIRLSVEPIREATRAVATGTSPSAESAPGD